MLLGNNFGKENSYIIIHDLIVFRQITPNINDRINVKLREYQSIINSSIKVTSILDIIHVSRWRAAVMKRKRKISKSF